MELYVMYVGCPLGVHPRVAQPHVCEYMYTTTNESTVQVCLALRAYCGLYHCSEAAFNCLDPALGTVAPTICS